MIPKGETLLGRTILVTGGAGFIGCHLVDRLLTSGAKVRVLDNLSSGSRDNVHPSATLYVGSATNVELMATAARNVDAIVHLAAIASVIAVTSLTLRYEHANPVAGSHGVDIHLPIFCAASIFSASSVSIWNVISELKRGDILPP